MDAPSLLAFAVTTTKAFARNDETLFRCALCSVVVRSSSSADLYPYCSPGCAVLADADNCEDGL